MNYVAFKISLEDSIKFLKKYKFYKGIGDKAIGDHSEEFKKVSRKNRHTDIFKVAIQNKDYEILLFDDSIFQFSFDNGVLRYSFIQNPNLFVSKKDFINALYTPDELLIFSDEELGELHNTIKEEEFEQFSNEQDINLEANIIRYDFDNKGYAPLIHSYSHIHIGLNENLRIPCSKIITPFKFVIFAVKHTYYDEWSDAFKKDPTLENIIDTQKKQCADLPAKIWEAKEQYELYLK